MIFDRIEPPEFRERDILTVKGMGESDGQFLITKVRGPKDAPTVEILRDPFVASNGADK